jgi:hypothetical protein
MSENGHRANRPSEKPRMLTPHFPILLTLVDLALPTFRSDHLSQLSNKKICEGDHTYHPPLYLVPHQIC